jgi:hypothetical protein
MDSYHFNHTLRGAVDQWRAAPAEADGQPSLDTLEEPNHQLYNQWLITETIKKDAASAAAELERACKPFDGETGGWVFDSYDITKPAKSNNCLRYIGNDTYTVTEGALLSPDGHVSSFRQEPDKPLVTNILTTSQLAPIDRVPETETLDPEPYLVAEWRGRLCKLFGIKYERLSSDTQPPTADTTDEITRIINNSILVEGLYREKAMWLAEQLRAKANPWSTVFGIKAWELGSRVRVTDTPGKHYRRSGRLLTARGDVAEFTSEFTQDEEGRTPIIPAKLYTTDTDFLGTKAYSLIPEDNFTENQRHEIDSELERFFAKATALL